MPEPKSTLAASARRVPKERLAPEDAGGWVVRPYSDLPQKLRPKPRIHDTADGDYDVFRF